MIPAISVLGIHPRNMKTLIQKAMCTPYVYCSITYNSQSMEAAHVSIDRWMEKDYCSVIRKNELLPFDTAWMDLQSIMLK